VGNLPLSVKDSTADVKTSDEHNHGIKKWMWEQNMYADSSGEAEFSSDIHIPEYCGKNHKPKSRYDAEHVDTHLFSSHGL
jgi:hypothetical protein